MSTPLNRTTAGERTGSVPPVRMVHLGLGAFHRAHQAWFTQHAETDAAHPEWGIAAFTGRSSRAADDLTAQDGLYILVERSAEGDAFELMSSVVEANPASDSPRLVALLSDADVAVVTLTVTEAGYHLDPSGRLDTDDEAVSSDVAALKKALPEPAAAPELRTAAGRLVLGLDRRIRSLGDRSGIAVVSCDNMADNATAVRNAVLGMARACQDGLAERLDEAVSWVGTSVDRITPATTQDLRREVAEETGYDDVAPVVAEPFRSWVLAGEFPAGRPAWENAGAEFVEDLEPFERRKLWLLNGTHSYMAYAGQTAGHRSVAEAIADPEILQGVEDFWDEAARHLTDPRLDIPAYRESLLARYRNPRIHHLLAQIGKDGAQKMRIRAVPVYEAERASGRTGAAAARSIRAWIDWLRTQNPEHLEDGEADALRQALAGAESARALLDVLRPGLGQDAHLVSLVIAGD